MQCEHCEASEAVIHLTQIVENEMKTYHLCEGCAAEQGLDPAVSAGGAPMTDFLAQVGKGLPARGEEEGAQCSYCGLGLDDFKETGRLGCSQCYSAFEPHLRGLLRRIHGGTQHVGKVYLPPDPSEAERRERLNGLRRELDRAVDREDFERAAQLRDRVRALEGAL